MFQDCAVMVTYSTLVIAMLAIKWRRILNAVNSNVACIILFVTSNAIFWTRIEHLVMHLDTWIMTDYC